ncbi:hypothetical protein TNCV_1128711 [Trichonephila clavipes]|nr:hypothetical protein TNCV_1128711 [Trichonephila clavipes]
MSLSAPEIVRAAILVLNFVDLLIGILTESITFFLELSCNLIVKKFDSLNVLARLHLGAEKELKWSHLDVSLKS